MVFLGKLQDFVKNPPALCASPFDSKVGSDALRAKSPPLLSKEGAILIAGGFSKQMPLPY
jgi:hypothetical protein